MRLHRLVVAVLGAVLCSHLLVQPSVAEDERVFFTARRSLGVLFIGGSLLLTKQGFEFRDEADELYVRYKKAGTSEEADRLYTRTNNRDVKKQVSWAVAAAFAVNGARLLLSKVVDSELSTKVDTDRRIAPSFSLEPQLEPRRFGLQIKRRFF